LLLLAACAPAAAPAVAPTVAPTTAPAAQPTALPTTAPTTPPEPTAIPASTESKLVDALGREVTFEKAPERIVIAGRATTLVADALYLFAEARERIAGIELRSQSAIFMILMTRSTLKAPQL
jgi:ABC-type Fe3+-hydroxamate transport system substrate-binding protein